jgi:lipoate-protein ligase A
MIEPWHLLRSPAASAAQNMAVDEALLRTAAQRARPLLRLYTWDQPAISFGYFQQFPVHLAGHQPIVRRPTGGGIVYHGDGVDTTYTVVAPPGHALHAMKTADAYRALHNAVAAALSLSAPLSTLHVSTRGQYECFQTPVAGDVVTADGQKLAGGAQRRGRFGMLHQGSIAGRVSADQLLLGFRQVLAAELTAYELSVAERALADQLTRDKYATDIWNKRVSAVP